jgi:hypothetical protein
MTIKHRVLLFLGCSFGLLFVTFLLFRIWQATNFEKLRDPAAAFIYLILLLMLVPVVSVIPSGFRGLFRSVRGR